MGKHETEAEVEFKQRRQMMLVPLLLRAKAEMVFGALLVVRSRTVWLACLLSLVAVVLSSIDMLGGNEGTNRNAIVFMIAGAIAAVVGSRLLAPGGALAASRQVAARFWLVPFGRLTGGMLVVLPVIAIAAFFLRSAEAGPVQLSMTVALYTAAVAAGVLTMAPAAGGSAAAAVGLVSVWVGVVPPVDVQAVLQKWPLLQRPLVLLWHLLPLQWRAGRLLDRFGWPDALVLLSWIALGLAFTGWTTTPVRPGGRWLRGEA